MWLVSVETVCVYGIFLDVKQCNEIVRDQQEYWKLLFLSTPSVWLIRTAKPFQFGRFKAANELVLNTKRCLTEQETQDPWVIALPSVSTF